MTTKVTAGQVVLLLVMSSIFFNRANSQSLGIDRKSKSVFTNYSLPDSRFDLNADGNLAYTFLLHKPDTVVYVLRGTNDTTIVKFRAWTMEFNVSTNEDLLSSENLSTLRPGGGFKIGYHVSIDTFKNMDTRLPSSKKSVKTYGINFAFDLSNIKLYDTISRSAGKKYPPTVGLETYYNFIFRKRDTTHKSRFVLALTASYKYTWNDDNLISYQNRSDAFVTSDVVALEEFDGRYGVLKKDVSNFRFSLAFPMYFGHFNLIPYSVWNPRSYNKPAYYFGLFTNVLKDKLNIREFKIPSSIGVGFDWKYQDSKFSKITFFIKGQIGFD